MSTHPGKRGFWIGLAVIAAWLLSTGWLISRPALPALWVVPMWVLLQTHLYTGLFITAHDCMHGLGAASPALNRWLGRLAAILFAFNVYDRLLPKHHAHHRHVATADDPDYARGGFLRWYFSFAREYITIWQILAMAVTYNLLKLAFPAPNLILFWIIPSILATLQLFYFGTYLPHRGEHDPADPHKACSQYRGHLWGFLSCYFFGYHYEHHAEPWQPWWRLWRVAERRHAGS